MLGGYLTRGVADLVCDGRQAPVRVIGIGHFSAKRVLELGQAIGSVVTERYRSADGVTDAGEVARRIGQRDLVARRLVDSSQLTARVEFVLCLIL